MTIKIRIQSPKRALLLGYGMAAMAAVGFSAKAILVKLAYDDQVDAVTLLALRMLFSTPFFLVVALWHAVRKNSPPLYAKDYLAVLLLGISGFYLSSLFDFIGLQYISAGLERLILFLYPTFVVLLSALYFAKLPGRKEIVALLFSYMGIAVVFYDEVDLQSDGLLTGAGFVFASTLSYAGYLIGVGQVVVKIGASRFTAYAMLVASVATVLQFLLTHSFQDLHLSNRVYLLSLTMAIVSTVLPVFLLSAAIHRIGSGHSALIGAIGPVSTLFMAAVVLGEELTALQTFGAVLVVMGVLSLGVK